MKQLCVISRYVLSIFWFMILAKSFEKKCLCLQWCRWLYSTTSINISKDASSSVLEPKIYQHSGLKFGSPQPYLRWLTTFFCLFFKSLIGMGFTQMLSKMKFTLLRDNAEQKKRKYCYYNVFFYFFQGKKLHSGNIFFLKTINLCLHSACTLLIKTRWEE